MPTDPTDPATTADEPVFDRRAVVSWCFFDWANSAFPTLIVTFVTAAYFTRKIAETPEQGTADWGTAMSLSALFVAIVSPVFGVAAFMVGTRAVLAVPPVGVGLADRGESSVQGLLDDIAQ